MRSAPRRKRLCRQGGVPLQSHSEESRSEES